MREKKNGVNGREERERGQCLALVNDGRCHSSIRELVHSNLLILIADILLCRLSLD